MFRRFVGLVALTVGLVWSTADAAFAQEPAATTTLTTATSTAVSFTLAPSPALAEQLPSVMPLSLRRTGGSALLTSLYASTAIMQALDVHSSLTAFKAGAVEANPLMQGVTGNRAAFIAVKAGVAASSIMAARHLAKRNKIAAIATLVAVNSAYAYVVNHNYRVARRLQ